LLYRDGSAKPVRGRPRRRLLSGVDLSHLSGGPRYGLTMSNAHLPWRIDRLAAGAVTLGLAWLAVGRQRALEPLSPPDLAFFHQSTWSAAQGLGFAQTALPFEGQGLFDSVHLSLVRALWVPPYALLPHVETLVALQALAVGAGALLVAALARHHSLSTRLSAALALAYGLHPMTVGLATADVRPIVFAVPALLGVVLGLERRSVGLILLGATGVIAAREEALWMLLALVPLAVMRRHWPSIAALAAGVAGALAGPLLAWGQLTNLSASVDHARQWADIVAGTRPFLRSGAEAGFGALSLALLLPALRAPLVLLPGVAAWAYLCVFSGLGLAVAGEPGVHYLAVVHPFLWAAAAVGMGKLSARPRLATGAAGVALLGAVATVMLMPRVAAWSAAVVSLPEDARALLAIARPVARDDGGLVAEPRLAPTLAGRAVLYVRGNHFAERADIQGLAVGLEWGLLEVEVPNDARPASRERKAWRRGMARAGLERQRVRNGIERWAVVRAEGATPDAAEGAAPGAD
jgi:uncharacterized membrane protein